MNDFIEPNLVMEYDPMKPAETIRKEKDILSEQLKRLFKDFYDKTGVRVLDLEFFIHRNPIKVYVDRMGIDKIDEVVLTDIVLEEL